MVCLVFNRAIIDEHFKRESACTFLKCREYPGVTVVDECHCDICRVRVPCTQSVLWHVHFRFKAERITRLSMHFFAPQIACSVFLTFPCAPLLRAGKNEPLVPLARNWGCVCQAAGSRHLKCGQCVM